MGLDQTGGRSISNGHLTKEEIRALHARQRAELLVRERDFIHKWQDRVIERFADGDEIDPALISPRIVQVRTEEQAALFRYAALHWSVPVSRGYGRRTRFLVMDRQNDKLAGIFALGDPVYNLTARDELIGWSIEQRNERLYNVLDAFVLGAVPPYRQLLGGKLVAMAAVSDTTREMIKRKYQGRVTEILGEVKQARPVLITTTSALARSSIYNRLKLGDELLYHSGGYTRGFGHFQFSEPVFRALVDLLSNDGRCSRLQLWPRAQLANKDLARRPCEAESGSRAHPSWDSTRSLHCSPGAEMEGVSSRGSGTAQLVSVRSSGDDRVLPEPVGDTPLGARPILPRGPPR